MMSIELFPFLTEEERAVLVPLLRERSLAAGERLFTQGEDGSFVAFIQSGRLAVRKPTEFPGRWQTIALLEAGSCAGEAGLLKQSSHGATVDAMESTRLVLLAREDFTHLAENAPTLAINMLRHLLNITSLRLHQASHRLSLVL